MLTIRSYGLRIPDVPQHNLISPTAQALNERMHKAIGDGAMQEAQALSRQLRQMCPEQPSPLVDQSTPPLSG